MKTKIKKTAGLIIIIFLGLNSVNAQLNISRADIINEKGHNYTSGTTEKGVRFITYENERQTKASGKYTQMEIYFFGILYGGTEIANKMVIIEPATETNTYVNFFRSIHVEIGYRQWKDSELENLTYKIEMKGEYCLIIIEYIN